MPVTDVRQEGIPDEHHVPRYAVRCLVYLIHAKFDALGRESGCRSRTIRIRNG
jgi:hypothetical protein